MFLSSVIIYYIVIFFCDHTDLDFFFHTQLQAQLRAFIPEMLKYSTGRGKPGWGKESCKPVWWPDDIPWANVRSDVRTEDQKQRVRSWIFPSIIAVITALSRRSLVGLGFLSVCLSADRCHGRRP